MEYPKSHKNIVKELLDGKFMLHSDPLYQILKDNRDFYEEFFKESFNYELRFNNDFAFLLSTETNETLSRDICIFFALLSYEIDRDGRNFIEEIQYSEWDMERINQYFDNTTYLELVHSNKQLRDHDSRATFINALSRRNIIEKTTEGRFVFTAAYKVFIDFAAELAKNKVKEGATE